MLQTKPAHPSRLSNAFLPPLTALMHAARSSDLIAQALGAVWAPSPLNPRASWFKSSFHSGTQVSHFGDGVGRSVMMSIAMTMIVMCPLRSSPRPENIRHYSRLEGRVVVETKLWILRGQRVD